MAAQLSWQRMLTGIHCVLQDYIQSIGSCLLQIGDATEGPLVDMMHKLTDESSQLLGCIKLLNLKVHEAMLHGELNSHPGQDTVHGTLLCFLSGGIACHLSAIFLTLHFFAFVFF